MRIEIDIPHPKRLVAWIVAVALTLLWVRWLQTPPGEAMFGSVRAEAEGGYKSLTPQQRREKAEEVQEYRMKLQLLARAKDIVEYHLSLVEEAKLRSDPASLREWQAHHEKLMILVRDKNEAERQLTSALMELQQAQSLAQSVSQARGGEAPLDFSWPVEPLLGISAHFHDDAYKQRFGIAHNAIDIPAEQGTLVIAAADGVVEAVRDRGMGFNALVLSHGGGYVTLYGHVSKFLVQEGTRVRRGDRVALSGGTPGTPGAGLLTTGPHLHLEVMREGEYIDPLTMLPPRS